MTHQRRKMPLARLVEIVGDQKAAALVAEFGGCRVPADGERLRRHMEARRLADEGVSNREIARRLRLTAARVAQICKVVSSTPE